MATIPNSSPSDRLQNADLGAAYQQVYDLLGTMYWEASGVDSKDLIFGAREAVGEILDQIDQQALASNEQAMRALTPNIAGANKALKSIQDNIGNITRNVSTASAAIAAISKVLSFFPALSL